jgi:hypothetical protein
VAGDPLTRTVDAGTPVNLAENVHYFQLVYLPSPNQLLNNHDAEDGTNYWSGYRCDIKSAATPGIPHNGRWLQAESRLDNTAGPRQFVTRKLRSGTTYRIEAWLRAATGSPTPRISLHLMTSDGPLEPPPEVAPAISSTDWSKRSVNLTTPTWTGELRWAYLKISTVADNPVLYCDDLTMTPVALDRIGIELQLGPNTQARSAISTRLVHHPIQ